jgi:ribosomal protein S18 acetylase RimI-like enzyme
MPDQGRSPVQFSEKPASPDFAIRPLTASDRDWVRRVMIKEWKAETVVVHETVYRPAELPGFVAEAGGKTVGLLTYRIAGEGCEIVTLNSWREGRGVGSALIDWARRAAGRAKCRRLWLVTTNDNTPALRFYQKRGFIITAIHVNAIQRDRRLKPEIPASGLDGIPIRDEIEMEMML